MQDVFSLLKTAERNLHPDYWTRVSPALDADGQPVGVLSPHARRRSLLALVHRVAFLSNAPVRPAVLALSNAAKELGYKFVDDAQTFEESRKILRRALWRAVDCNPFEPAQAA